MLGRRFSHRINLSFIRELSNGPTVARPRAAASSGIHGKRVRRVAKYAVAGGTVLFGAYIAHLNSYSGDVFLKNIKELWLNLWERDLGDPKVEDLQKALGDPPPPHYINIFLSLEDVLLVREWDRRIGYTIVPREGMVELLRWLVDPASGCFVTLWTENSSTVAGEISEHLLKMMKGPSSHTPPVSSFFSLGYCFNLFQKCLLVRTFIYNASLTSPNVYSCSLS